MNCSTSGYGIDHDTGFHTVTFTHDGRYNFHCGDSGFDVIDNLGNGVVSPADGPYFAVTTLRVNPTERRSRWTRSIQCMKQSVLLDPFPAKLECPASGSAIQDDELVVFNAELARSLGALA